PNGIPSSIASFPRSPRTGRASPWIATRTSCGLSGPLARRLGWRSPHTLIAATIRPALSPHQNSCRNFVFDSVRFSRNGITRSHQFCNVIFASALRVRARAANREDAENDYSIRTERKVKAGNDYGSSPTFLYA